MTDHAEFAQDLADVLAKHGVTHFDNEHCSGITARFGDGYDDYVYLVYEQTGAYAEGPLGICWHLPHGDGHEAVGRARFADRITLRIDKR